jgi:hypothetical protein
MTPAVGRSYEHLPGFSEALHVCFQFRIGLHILLENRFERRVHRAVDVLTEPFVDPLVRQFGAVVRNVALERRLGSPNDQPDIRRIGNTDAGTAILSVVQDCVHAI